MKNENHMAPPLPSISHHPCTNLYFFASSLSLPPNTHTHTVISSYSRRIYACLFFTRAVKGLTLKTCVFPMPFYRLLVRGCVYFSFKPAFLLPPCLLSSSVYLPTLALHIMTILLYTHHTFSLSHFHSRPGPNCVCLSPPRATGAHADRNDYTPKRPK